MFGDLPPSSVVDGMRFCAAYCMISRPVAVSPVKAIFAIRLFVASALPISAPGPLTMLITPAGTIVLDQLGELEDRPRRRARRLEHGAVARGDRRGHLPGRHQQREVERDDLPDDAERLVEVVGDRVLVDLRDRCPPRRGSPTRSSGSGRPPAGCRRRASRGPACRCRSSRRPRASRGSPRSRRRSRSAPARARSSRSRPTRPWRRARRRGRARCRRRRARTCVNGLPVAGVRFSRYSPVVGATQSPPMKFS